MSEDKIRPGGVIEEYQSLIHGSDDENTPVIPDSSPSRESEQSRFVKENPDAKRLTEIQPTKIQRTFRQK